MNQNKVLILVTDLEIGGIQNYVRAQIKILSQMQFDVYTIVINKSQDQESEYLISLNHLKSYQKPLYIKNFIKKNKIQFLLDHRTKSNFLKGKIYDFLLRSIPKIQFIHSANLELYFYSSSLLNQLLYQNTTLFIAVSKHIQNLVQEHTNKPVEVVYHFFDQKRTKAIDVKYKNYLLFIGRFDNKVKDLDFLLKSYLASGLHKKGIKFLFVGDGKDKSLITHFAVKHQLLDFIEIHPAIKNPDSYYQHAKVVVLASCFEGFPLVLLEAIFHNTPVVTTAFNPSVHEIVLDKSNGLIVDKKIDTFAMALRKIEEDVNFYDYLWKQAQAPMSDVFTKTHAINNWSKLLKNYLKTDLFENGTS